MRRRFEHFAIVLVIVVLMAPVLIALAHAVLPVVLAMVGLFWLARWIWPLRM